MPKIPDDLSQFALSADPFGSFDAWFAAAGAAGVAQRDAMTLATATRKGAPSARLVLFKGWDRGRLLFFSNYRSPKSADLARNPKAEVVFFWPALHQQIRIAGSVRKLTRRESAAYFATRPRESQIGAWASDQSQPLADRQELDRRVAAAEAEFLGRAVPCPPNWGGFRLMPASFEFWQGQQARLHDRFLYRKKGRSWQIDRLSP